MKKAVFIFFVLSMLITAVSVAEARLFRVWTYPELQTAADLIVVARPTKVDKLDEKYDLPDITYHAAGVETTFTVLAALKGEMPGTPIVLHHYKSATDGPEIDGPMFISFDAEGCDNYLMFLKKRADGQYEGVAGQTDLVLSVKKLGCL